MGREKGIARLTSVYFGLSVFSALRTVWLAAMAQEMN